MNLKTLVWRELAERPSAMLTSTLTILLGVTALVAIRHVTVFSEREVGQQLQSLGANVLVLPKDATLQDYYSADLTANTLPESHVSSILLENLAGVERLSPKLCVSAKVANRDVTLTGILPQSEFQAKAVWQSVSLFSNKHEGCKKAACGPKTYDALPESLASERTIDQLKGNEAIIGADVAEFSGLKPGESVELLGEKLQVLAVLPRTGTVDDSRVFAHLHTVQRLTNAGEVVNAIEVMGCCEDAAGGLVPKLAELLPDAKVVTISQVVSTQVGINRLMSQMSLFVLGILVIVGGASVASTISSNVRERRREVGTLMALGATPSLVTRMFLLKAWTLGIVGAVGGSVLGLIVAMVLGSQWAGVTVKPLPDLIALSIGAALVITTLAALWPARSAAKLTRAAASRRSNAMFHLQGITKVYRRRQQEVVAFKAASLDIGLGEYVAVVGPSGSGKTTLLSMLGGMLSPDTGKVWFEGESLYDLPITERTRRRRERIGFVFQTFNLVPYLTALENVQVPLFLHGVSKSEQRNRAVALLEQVGLGNRIEHKPSELSTGQQQRVALARTLANNPRLILADEPTGNLDPDSREAVLSLFDKFVREGRTIVMVTHDPGAAARASRQLRLNDGMLITPETIPNTKAA